MQASISRNRGRQLPSVTTTAVGFAVGAVATQGAKIAIRRIWGDTPGGIKPIRDAVSSGSRSGKGRRKRTRGTRAVSSIPAGAKSLQMPNHWTTPVDERPTLAFGKGNVSMILDTDTLGQIKADSPATAIALCEFIALHQGEYLGSARQRLTALLQTCWPSSAAILSDQAGRRESGQVNDFQLTSQLTKYELQFLELVHNAQTGSKQSLRKMVRELEQIADALVPRNSHRRQASARIILANLHLRLGDFDTANTEMAKALVLIGATYKNSDLIGIATEAVGSGIIDTTFSDAGSDEQLMKVRQLVRTDGSRQHAATTS